MRSKHLLCLLPWLLPGMASASDGGSCPTTGRHSNTPIGVLCTWICDSKTSSDSTCPDFTIDSPADTYILEISSDTGCNAAATATITTKGLSGANAHSLTALVRGGVDEVVIHGEAAHPLTTISTTLSTMTACTDFDVKLWRFYEKR